MQELVAEPSDPAIVKATLGEVFEASQDVMDQMGRAAALQHLVRRFHLMRDVGLAESVAEGQLSQMPLTPKWLFGESISKVTERIKVQKPDHWPQLPREGEASSQRENSTGRIPSRPRACPKTIRRTKGIPLNPKVPLRRVGMPRIRRESTTSSSTTTNRNKMTGIPSPFSPYLRFCFGGAHFQFRALPFGLSSSPRTFCKCPGWCHSQGFRVMAYLDDWLLIHPDRGTLTTQSQQLLQLLQHLGWIVSYKKSRLMPSLQFPFIGLDFDPMNNSMAPSLDRITNLSHMARRLLDHPAAPALTFLEVLGHMASMIEILPTTCLQMRNIRMCLLHQWKAKLESPYKVIWVYQSARDNLLWWMNATNMIQGAPIWPAEMQTMILTDASKEGWGPTARIWRSKGRGPKRNPHTTSISWK